MVLRVSAVCRVITAAVLFLISLSALLLPAAAQNSAPVSAVWLADHKHLKRIDLVTNQADLIASLDHEAEALAVDPMDNGVWVLAQKKLFKFDSNGQSAFHIELKDIADKLDDPKHLVLNPYDASLWVGGEKSLLHVDAQGQRLGAWKVAEVIQAMTLDADESLWLLGHRHLWHISREGAVMHSLDLRSQIKEPEHIAIDSLGGLLWVAGKQELIRFELSHLDQVARTVILPSTTGNDESKILAVAVDPLLGSLWVATKKNRLFIYDREVNLLKTIDFGSHVLGEPQILVFEPVSTSSWLGGKKALARFSSNGDFVARIDVEHDTDALGAAHFRLVPTLSLMEPADGSLTNNSRPPIRLGLGASCNAVPCLLPEAYSQSLALNVDLNGSPIGPLFTRSATEALYLSPNRLPEGLNVLNAQAFDLFGHPSNRISADFVIDTIAPQFLSVTPADSTNVPQSEVTIAGSLDDPTANVLLLDGNGSVVAAGGAAFSFVVPLKPGTNFFTMLARDLAGNESSMLLRLLHSSLSVRITSPAAGTALDRARVLVSGTFQGPANTGISVNGTVALVVSGDRFLLNLDLALGPNTLTATATTLDGATATDTLNVSVSQTEADPFEISIAPAMGIAPLPVRFTVGNFSGQNITRVELDTDGDGSTDRIVTDLSVPIDIIYANPGVYTAHVKLIYGQDQSYEQTLAVVVQDAVQMDTLFTNLWNGMNDELVRGDVSTALTYFNEGAKRKYGPVFQALAPHMPQIVASYSPLRRVSISEDIGEYAIMRNVNGQNRLYLIYFLRDADGVWRMDAM